MFSKARGLPRRKRIAKGTAWDEMRGSFSAERSYW
jgi:hypothetical protein